MGTVAFAFALLVFAVGAAGALSPPSMVWLAGHFTTPGAFYLLAVVRISFGRS